MKMKLKKKAEIKPDVNSFTDNQKRAVAVALVLSIIFGAYYLRHYFVLVAMSAIVAFLFMPLYQKMLKRLNKSLSILVTLLAAICLVLIPVAGVLTLSVLQTTSSINSAISWFDTVDVGDTGHKALETVNSILASTPYTKNVVVTSDNISSAVTKLAQSAGQWFVNSMSGLIGGFLGFITTVIIFIYVFISMLVNSERLKKLIGMLNPMGEEVTNMYLQKAGAMVYGAVGGQFVIAVLQGVTGALSLYIAGFHQGFFIIAMLFTLLSMVPLGSGIITIPAGIIMLALGNVTGGLFVILWHILGASNIDNILRPILVPKSARLDPALMLVTVFAGLSMFGFWGLFIGPVIMILIVSTIRVYLAVYKNIPLSDASYSGDDKADEHKEDPTAI